uniref:Uncharacterized protein n=1 Tax=Vitis vinifera TaxID=29760 RepID=A5B578_VITVI|nr:hypothetical protein VITISV_015466 [Vitis vinifera]
MEGENSLHLEWMNIDYAIRKDKQIIIATNTIDEKALYEQWERYRLSVMFIKTKISTGSQQSNASNGARFGVEMKELQPLQANHSKLKAEWCTTAKSAFGCENVVLLLRKFCSHFAQCRGVLLKLLDICDRHFEIFCFRYLMSKSPNSPCNPPIIGFLSL